MKGPDGNIFGSGQELQTEQNIKCMHPDFEKASIRKKKKSAIDSHRFCMA